MRKFITGLAIAAVAAAGCNKVEFQKTSSGVPYKVFPSKAGDSIRQNYIVRFEVIQRTKDTVLFSSYEQGQPQYLQVQPVPAATSYTNFGENIMEILPRLKKGDSVYMVHAADSLINSNPMMQQNFLKKGGELVTTIRITEVYKTPEEANEAVTKDRIAQSGQREQKELELFRKDSANMAQMVIDNRIIEEYLSRNNIQARKTDWGTYVQVINEGSPKPSVGQFANIKYSGRLLNGATFDSGEFPIQVGMGGAIKGFEDGVRQFGQGGKGVIYIPSRLGYGVFGSGDKIPANSILVFDIEVLNISDNPPGHHPGDGHGH